MSETRDIVIAGGGMVGVSLALELARALPGLDICLLEGFPFPEPRPDGPPDYHPSFDARSTALSYSSYLIYRELGLWDVLSERACPIESIHVSSRGRFGSTLMDARDHDWPALGYVVENAWLGNVLIQALYRQGAVEARGATRVEGAAPCAHGTRLTLAGGDELDARLLLVADGAGSGLRDALGVAVAEKPYGQHALIANIASARAHSGCAYERFTDEGPLALLPLLPSAEGASRSALVWSLPPERSEALLACSDEQFLAELHRRFGYRLGRLQAVGERSSYPLSLVEAREQVRSGIVVMGNAAHAMHPVAGQGFNLALRDVARLVQVLAQGRDAGAALGELGVLQRYQRLQRTDQERTIGASDQLPALFMNNDPLLGVARDLALSGLDVLTPLKRGFVRYAAGVAEMGERASG